MTLKISLLLGGTTFMLLNTLFPVTFAGTGDTALQPPLRAGSICSGSVDRVKNLDDPRLIPWKQRYNNLSSERLLTRGEFVFLIVDFSQAHVTSSGVVSRSYRDVSPRNRYFPWIEYATKKGIIHGTRKGYFEPNRMITRAEATKIFAEASGLTGTLSQSSFIDVPLTHSLAPYIAILFDRCLIDGKNTKDGKILFGSGRIFVPENGITRDEALKILVNLSLGTSSGNRRADVTASGMTPTIGPVLSSGGGGGGGGGSVALVPIGDNTPPTVFLSGGSNMILLLGSGFIDPGAYWTDDRDGSGSSLTGTYGARGSFTRSGVLDMDHTGVYIFEYRKVDAAGNSGSILRSISIITGDTTPPGIPNPLIGKVISGRIIELVWSGSTDSGGVRDYEVERCTGSGWSDCSLLSQTVTGTYTQDATQSGYTLLRYRVRARDISGNISLFSDPIFLRIAATGEVPVFSTNTPREFFPPFIVDAAEIRDQSGKLVSIRGVNWFGFETLNGTVHGIWSRGYSGMITQMKELGFNAVRLPFCPGTLRGDRMPWVIDYTQNPTLSGKNTLETMDIIIEALARNGMFIVLDHHRSDCVTISDLPMTGGYLKEDWLHDLAFVAERYKNNPFVIGVDLKNEPTGIARWGTGNSDEDWKHLAEQGAETVLSVNPNLLIVVEGIYLNNGYCESTYPTGGGGNIEPIDCAPLDPLIIPPHRLVLSPHIYGPDVWSHAYLSDISFPANMGAIWEQQFGRFIGRYAIIIGEFGGTYTGQDVLWQNAFVDYLLSKGVRNFFYWSWNPNSQDTGGILNDDWTTVNILKYTNLARLFSY